MAKAKKRTYALLDFSKSNPLVLDGFFRRVLWVLFSLIYFSVIWAILVSIDQTIQHLENPRTTFSH